MDKEKFVEILKSIEIPTNEGIQNDKNTNKYPRIVYWDYAWEPMVASECLYSTKVTYQVSFFSNKPRDEKLIELRNNLASNKVFPFIEHEYIEKDRCFHSFFAVEVLENIE